jgi:hexokinase
MLAAEQTVHHLSSSVRTRMPPSSNLDMQYAFPEQVEAVADIQKLFNITDQQLADFVKRMGEEMQIGLERDDASDLKMIPSFVTGKRPYSQ